MDEYGKLHPVRIYQTLKHTLLIMLLTILASGVANAKVASGLQNLSADLHQDQSVLNALMHQVKTDISTIFMSGSSVVPKGPTLDVSRSATPEIAKNVENAISDGAPTTLTREASKRQIRRNRRDALRGQQAAGPGKSLDEYPFASTKQGGSGACVAAVCAREQSVQGGQLSQFYQRNNINDGDSFNVRVVD